jgi:hypothetical protein
MVSLSGESDDCAGFPGFFSFLLLLSDEYGSGQFIRHPPP